jgi:hypothetical protein
VAHVAADILHMISFCPVKCTECGILR